MEKKFTKEKISRCLKFVKPQKLTFANNSYYISFRETFTIGEKNVNYAITRQILFCNNFFPQTFLS